MGMTRYDFDIKFEQLMDRAKKELWIGFETQESEEE